MDVCLGILQVERAPSSFFQVSCCIIKDKDMILIQIIFLENVHCFVCLIEFMKCPSQFFPALNNTQASFFPSGEHSQP
jgi:hypothetical protein